MTRLCFIPGMFILASLCAALPAAAEWQPGGNTVATLNNLQTNPRVITDQLGGGFIACAGFPGFSPSLERLGSDDSPATLELFDVSGRRVLDRSLRDGAGERTIALAPRERLAPGVYLLRLSQRTQRATLRLVVTR